MVAGNFDRVLVFSLTVPDYCWHACNGRVAMVTRDSWTPLSRSGFQGETESRCGTFSPLTGGRSSRGRCVRTVHTAAGAPHPNHGNLVPVRTFLLRFSASKRPSKGLEETLFFISSQCFDLGIMFNGCRSLNAQI